MPVRGKIEVPPGPSTEQGKFPGADIEPVADLVLGGQAFEFHDDLKHVARAGSPLGHEVEAVEDPIDPRQMVLVLRRRQARHE